ncbi:protein PHOSPHATE-INDUCED 1-like [Phragmites australis]|uniref:protein PHOSPHATE-INDUCED 1-like n=1 Tax=Phragmites australis TaxID=29695 RepID=UPI002D765830|nr:protein PHOSPHATE-INDUCED 1-like [Phragmites australis]
MASYNLFDAKRLLLAVTLVLLSLCRFSLGARQLPELTQTRLGDELSYHGGAVLHGDIPVSIIWYGQFKPAQKAIVVDFLLSLTSLPVNATPSAAQWWGTIDRAYLSNATASVDGSNATRVLLAGQVSDEQYSLGKSLTLVEIFQLAAGLVPKEGALVLVLTDPDVVIEGFCSARCGLHGSDAGAGYAYAWVGNAERQCPGQCAWPFAKPAYGQQDLPPLSPPNGDVGVDGMVVTLSSMVAGAVTNPFGDGYYEGAKDAALEACTACAGEFGTGAYPGYPGKVPVDETTGGSYNAVGANGRKYLLPAIYDLATSACSTLI